MRTNRTAQLIFQTAYCTLGLVGCIACVGVFEDVANLRWGFYVHFTNLSNFFCLMVMTASLVQTVKRKQDGYVTAMPHLKFMGLLCIVLTFLVFNFLLARVPGRNPQLNWTTESIIFHEILPVMYVADWFLFRPRKTAKWYDPFVSLLFPFFYAVFIYTQAALLRFDSSILLTNSKTPLIYPYFFLNLETQGVWGVAKWFGLIFVVFVGTGYLLYGLNRIGPKGPNRSKGYKRKEEGK